MARKEKDAPFKEYGLRLKEIRETIKMTADALNSEAGVARSYFFNFENGLRLPTPKYLKYLHDKHNVDLNYIFGSSKRMFRPTPEEALPEFGPHQDDVNRMLRTMAELRPLLFAVLGFFTEYEYKNKETLDLLRSGKAAKANKK